MIFIDLSKNNKSIFYKNFIETRNFYSLFNNVFYFQKELKLNTYLKYINYRKLDSLIDNKVYNKRVFIFYDQIYDLFRLKNIFHNCQISIMAYIKNNSESMYIKNFFYRSVIKNIITDFNCVDSSIFKLGYNFTDIKTNNKILIDFKTFLYLLKKKRNTLKLIYINFKISIFVTFSINGYYYNLNKIFSKIDNCLFFTSIDENNLLSIYSKNLKKFKKITEY